MKDILRATPPPIPGAENKSNTTPPPPITINITDTGKYFGYELARRRERLFAVIVEGIIIMIPMLIFFGDNSLDAENSFNLTLSIQSAIFSAILGAIFYSMWSGNLGHKIMGLKVISSVDGSDYNKWTSGALREGLKSIFGIVCIPVIWLLWDNDRQNLYDKVINTYVVKKK